MREPLVIRLPAVARRFQAVMICGFVAYSVWRFVDSGWPVHLVVAAALAVGVARTRSMVVRAEADGLFVRNRMATRRIPWGEIDGFRADRKQVHVLLRDGTMLALDATQRDGSRARELVPQLEARRPY